MKKIILLIMLIFGLSQAGIITHYLAYKVGQNDGEKSVRREPINMNPHPCLEMELKNKILLDSIVILNMKMDSLKNAIQYLPKRKLK